MRTLEIRRHTVRHKPGQNINQQGVELARRVGAGMGRFDVVVTSPLPRAFQTAIAMGYAVDDEIAEIGVDAFGDPGADYDSWRTFEDIARSVERDKGARKPAEKLLKTWKRLARLADDGGRVLAISHGGVIELGAIACFPDADHAAWGPLLGYCEGVRASFDGEAWANLEVLRVKQR